MSETAPPLILASGSVYRRQLLERLTTHFEVARPGTDETPMPGESPADLAQRLAAEKAAAIAAQHPDAVIIGSDQVASVGGARLGKPGDFDTAVGQLAQCSGQTVEFHTGVTVCCVSAGFTEQHVDLTKVYFRELSTAAIEAYLRADEPWDCAGSFRSEGLGAVLFERIENQDPTALIGLPLIWVAGALRRAGIQLPA